MPVNILNLAGLNVIDFKESETDYHVKAQPTVVSKLCPHCGRVNQRPIVSRCQRPNLSSCSGGCDGFFPLFEAVGIVAGFEDFAVMGDAIEQGGRHLWIAEHGHPFAE